MLDDIYRARHPNPCDPELPVATRDRDLPPCAFNRSCVVYRRADLPETGPRPSIPFLPEQWTYPLLNLLKRRNTASPQSTLPALTIFESWLPMDSEIFRRGNCNAKQGCPSE